MSEIASYLGSSDQFDEAMGRFAVAYADQTERDHAALKAAVRRGTVEAFREGVTELLSLARIAPMCEYTPGMNPAPYRPSIRGMAVDVPACQGTRRSQRGTRRG